jgi:surfeit locus 1 family protein
MMVARMFSRRWIISTILVVCGAAVLVRLGIWQLDRLAQRRSFNTRVEAQIEREPLDLNAVGDHTDLGEMEYRKVQATGEYDLRHQVALRNQYWGDQWGVHLVTPLHISGTGQVVLVDRGWIPAEDYQSGDWAKYDEPGLVTVAGILRNSQDKAELGNRRDPQPNSAGEPLNTWNFVNIERLSLQMGAPLLPAYIQQAPDPNWTSMPYRYQPTLELTEGPHFGYALQWFTFAAILVIGDPFFIQRQERLRQESEALKPAQLQPSEAVQSRKP